jgi:hypothetical protein
LRSSVFIAFFSDTSIRGHPRVPSVLCSHHLRPSLFLFDIESLPPQTMKLQLLGSRNTDLYIFFFRISFLPVRLIPFKSFLKGIDEREPEPGRVRIWRYLSCRVYRQTQ